MQPLRLLALLNGTADDIRHDVGGILKHYDSDTGEYEPRGFLPRFAQSSCGGQTLTRPPCGGCDRCLREQAEASDAGFALPDGRF